MEQEFDSAKFIQQIGEAMTKAAATFMEAFDKAAPILRQFLYDWAWLEGETPAHRYALAGYPFGKTSRGKKRWILEMKRRHR